MTSKFCVVGSPVEHSLSPAIHSAAYAHLGFDFIYEKHEVSSGELSSFLREYDFDGLSVTMPLKQEALLLAETSSEVASSTGVANTLVRTSSGWAAHNTDVFGISECIKSAGDVKQAIVLGSGATARSAIAAIVNLYPEARISIMARNAESGNLILGYAQKFSSQSSLVDPSTELIAVADLVISTVPGDSYSELWADVGASSSSSTGLFLDVAYNPWPSAAASSWGGLSVSGLEMLIWQAVEQVRLFAQSQNESNAFQAAEVYEVMKKAVSGITDH